jgi:hypothetical protein
MRQWNADRPPFDIGEHEANFVVIAEISEELVKQHNIAPPVPCEYQEVKAFIGGRFAYDMCRTTDRAGCAPTRPF